MIWNYYQLTRFRVSPLYTLIFTGKCMLKRKFSFVTEIFIQNFKHLSLIKTKQLHYHKRISIRNLWFAKQINWPTNFRYLILSAGIKGPVHVKIEFNENRPFLVIPKYKKEFQKRNIIKFFSLQTTKILGWLRNYCQALGKIERMWSSFFVW